VTASMSSATSFWAALSSKRRAGGGLNIGTALRFEGDRTIQRREILLSPSTTFGDKQPMRHPQAKVNAWGDSDTRICRYEMTSDPEPILFTKLSVWILLVDYLRSAVLVIRPRPTRPSVSSSLG
jgi:hypothetical protein